MAFLVLIALWLSACTRVATGTPGPSGDAIFTAAAQTVEAEITLIASKAETSATQVSTLPSATFVPLLSPSPSTDDEPISADVPCDRGGFVADITIPDGQEFLPGVDFEKTWRLNNNGSCTWNSAYTIVFDKGDAMGGPASLQLTEGSVPPGEEIVVSVNLVAPDEPGSYRGEWKLRNSSQTVFGLGSKGDAAFWVEIEVIAPQNYPLY